MIGQVVAADALELHGITVRRGHFTLGPITVRLRAGEITTLVGANGAGKTTLVRSLLGQVASLAGQVLADGAEVDLHDAGWRSRVGFVPDDPEELLQECTAEEMWRFVAGVQTRRLPRRQRAASRAEILQRADVIADDLGFRPPRRKPIAEFSHGMRKKTQLVAALATGPSIVIMDEPRNGLDPVGIAQLHPLLTQLVDDGATVLVATHDLAWALQHSHHIVALRAGQVVLDVADEQLDRLSEAALVTTLVQG